MKKTITWYTRCPDCMVRIGLTDWDDGDVVLSLHRRSEHEVPLPEWYPKSVK